MNFVIGGAIAAIVLMVIATCIFDIDTPRKANDRMRVECDRIGGEFHFIRGEPICFARGTILLRN